MGQPEGQQRKDCERGGTYSSVTRDGDLIGHVLLQCMQQHIHRDMLAPEGSVQDAAVSSSRGRGVTAMGCFVPPGRTRQRSGVIEHELHLSLVKVHRCRDHNGCLR